MPPFSRRAAPPSRCSWRQRNSSSCVSRSSRSPRRRGRERVAEHAQRVRSVSTPERLPGDELRHPERVELAERVLVVGQQVLGRELQQDRVVALEGGEDVGVGLQRGEAARAQVARAAAGLAAALDRRRSRARWRPPSRPRPASRARAARGRRLVGGEHLVQLVDEPLLGERQRVGLRPAPAAAAAGACGSPAAAPPRRPGGPNWRRSSAWRTAIVSATLVALIDAPQTLMRPWISVPIIVKKRLVGFSIGLKYVPSGATCA